MLIQGYSSYLNGDTQLGCYKTSNLHIHLIVTDLLQALLSRGEAALDSVQICQTALLSRLSLSISQGELELQNKLLHVLHSVIHQLDILLPKIDGPRESNQSEKEGLPSREGINTPNDIVSSHFLQVVIDGISLQTNPAIMHHWIDFVLMSMPQLRRSRETFVLPVLQCLIDKMKTAMGQLQKAWSISKEIPVMSEHAETDMTVLLNAAEHLVLGVLEAKAKMPMDELPAVKSVSQMDGSTSFLGYVSTVLGASDTALPPVTDKSEVFQCTAQP